VHAKFGGMIGSYDSFYSHFRKYFDPAVFRTVMMSACLTNFVTVGACALEAIRLQKVLGLYFHMHISSCFLDPDAPLASLTRFNILQTVSK